MNKKTLILAIFLSALLLSACAPSEESAVQEGSETLPSSAQKPTTTKTAEAPTKTAATRTPNRALLATQTATACLTSGGEIKERELQSEILPNELDFRVYTPPCYTEQIGQSYPVLYLIHGQSFSEDQWDRLGVDEMADALVASGDLPPFIIVMPFDRSSQQPSIDLFGQAVLDELIPWIDDNYRTIPQRESRAVGGLSRGASWAFHLALLNPDLFGSVGGHSPPVFVEDAPFMRQRLDNIPADLMPRIWLDIGERDQQVILESAKWFAAILDELNIPHEWHLFTGNHDEAYWSSHLEMYLQWYAQLW